MPLRERIGRTDGLIDGCAAVRADGLGDRDGGRQRDNEIEVRAKGLPPSDKSPEKQKSGSMARLTLTAKNPGLPGVEGVLTPCGALKHAWKPARKSDKKKLQILFISSALLYIVTSRESGGLICQMEWMQRFE